jgi:O-antigen ligase
VQAFKSKYTDYILFPIIVLFTASIPFPIAYNSTFSILLFIVFLFDLKNIKTNLSLYFSNTRNILLLIIFLALLLSIFYSEDKKAAMKGILTALPLLSIPLAMTTMKNLPSWQIDILKKVFVLSCLITSLIYFVQTGIRIGLFDGSYRFKPISLAYQSSYLVYNLTYHQLTPSIHAVFFSLYISFAVIILIFGFEKKTTLFKILQGLMIIYFLVYLIMLTSATINFALYSFIIVCIFLRSSFKKLSDYILFFGLIIAGTAVTDYLLVVKYIGPDIGDIVYRFDSPSINQKIIISFVAVIIIGAAAIIVKLIAKRRYKAILVISFLIVTLAGLFYFKKLVDNKSTSDWKLNNISVRASYGSEAIRIIKQHPLLGVGIGDKKYRLIERNMELGERRYIEFGASTKPNDIFNSHNQFLDFWIAAGIIPVICLLLFFINQFSKAIRYKSILYLGLLYCFFLFCLTDMAMMVQRGQIFFLFFICLFEIESRKKMTAPSL